MSQLTIAADVRQQVTDRDRYHALVDELQYAAKRELIFGTRIRCTTASAPAAFTG
jgi:gamma-glutamyl:cysteine ligase YbdK (ATP-grasp superfamily)